MIVGILFLLFIVNFVFLIQIFDLQNIKFASGFTPRKNNAKISHASSGSFIKTSQLKLRNIFFDMQSLS
jgi:hypothetical protein